jgi:hypothetical protein
MRKQPGEHNFMSRVTFGSTEVMSLPSLSISDIIAKVDTGAWSCALHCTDIYEENGVLYFMPLGLKELASSTDEFELRQVRSSNGQAEERYFITTDVVIRGNAYHTTIGLSDRSEMQREVLIGRKFLIENKVLVDVELTLGDDHEAEKYL